MRNTVLLRRGLKSESRTSVKTGTYSDIIKITKTLGYYWLTWTKAPLHSAQDGPLVRCQMTWMCINSKPKTTKKKRPTWKRWTMQQPSCKPARCCEGMPLVASCSCGTCPTPLPRSTKTLPAMSHSSIQNGP
jgi:hypothetical protein